MIGRSLGAASEADARTGAAGRKQGSVIRGLWFQTLEDQRAQSRPPEMGFLVFSGGRLAPRRTFRTNDVLLLTCSEL